ncbi:PH domain-containing protein [Aestuariimicrobium kwangyangense]|uniref:PH domain-containing protein n=1 Tax=Aestuariimicrobium kwangyangense TaxID=396389 RepID=UPI0003B433AD|nr:PH domain-containing protein [Aestuariimicrobium kwangyangense]
MARESRARLFKGRGDSDERTLVRVRTHGKAVFVPILLALLVASLAAALIAVLPPEWKPIATWVTIGAAALLVLWFSVRPFIEWFTTSYTITTRRVITKHGVLNRYGHELPLSRIDSVGSERGIIDRMFGCGTLVFSTASERPVVLHDVPQVKDIEGLLADLIYRAHRDDQD